MTNFSPADNFSPAASSPGALAGAFERLKPVDESARAAAKARQSRLTKPAGALGRLESVGEQLCAIAGQCPPPVPTSVTVGVFAGDHGVLAEGVTPWPREVTAQMVANFLAGGAAINVIAREVGAEVVVIDVGVATPIPGLADGVRNGGGGGFVAANVRLGTGNLAVEPAMTLEEATAALDTGAAVAAAAVAGGANCLVTGDMGIGNTTPSAALIAAFTGRAAREATGRGTGITDEVLAVKLGAVERGIERTAALLGVDVSDLASLAPTELVSQLGGLEIAALAGFIVGGAAAGVPVIVDGVISLAGAVVACALAPSVRGYLIAGHRSTEPGATMALDHLGLLPLLDLELRLGEGTGGCLAVPAVRSAARILGEMATFGDAGVESLEH